jgi:hypothetical protein
MLPFGDSQAPPALRLVAVVVLLGACLDDRESPGTVGVVSGGAAHVTNSVVIGWAQDCAPSFGVDGDVEVVDDAFALDDLLASNPVPELQPCRPKDRVERCDDVADRPFGLGWLFGVSHGQSAVPETLPLGTLLEDTTGAADTVVAVYTPREITRSMDEWAHFETELPAGLSIMRMVPCNVWDERFECWLDFGPRFCLEPLVEGALVTVRGW